jgi:hypothetical protein
MEHRCGYRRAVSVPVIVRSRAGAIAHAQLCEVSASGSRLVTSLRLPLQTVVMVQFSRHAAGGRFRRTLEAEVVRHTETGFAVEWNEFSPEALRSLYAARVERSGSALESPGTPRKVNTG